HVFEWQPGSLFMLPINCWHQLVNASSSPALLIAATNAPPVFNIFQSHRYVFENDFDFVERFDGSDDFFKPKTELEAETVRGGAVLVCLRGKGYSYNWPKDLGPRPWEAGHGDQVKISEYIPGGLVAAAPGGGNWFHQHFSCGADPLRIINYWGGPVPAWTPSD